MSGNNLKVMIILMGCILMLFTGCGAPSAEPTDVAQAETKGGGSEYITAEQAKESALGNAGIPSENAEFMQVRLNTKEGVSVYELQFVSGSQEYDYAVNALTGEIISMNCQNTAYDTTPMPAESSQTVDAKEAAVPQEGVAEQGGSVQETAKQSGSSTQARDSSIGSTGKAGGQSGTDEQYIGTEAAKKAALDHAGLKDGEVNFAQAHLEFDDGCWQYEVEFYKNDTEYDYNIDALTGAVLKYDHDMEHSRHGSDNHHDSHVSGETITPEAAKQIALEYAGVAPADAQYLKAELDYDDGRAEYEVEWKVGATEYSCDVDACTGGVLAFEKDFD